MAALVMMANMSKVDGIGNVGQLIDFPQKTSKVKKVVETRFITLEVSDIDRFKAHYPLYHKAAGWWQTHFCKRHYLLSAKPSR
ncbi:hypothetical protein SAMN05216516_10451 [Izhakiella capsodis]|uniref:Uncharacterized protein n=1 Tax=Izhakiella capsodis TaxID=1367852 RepID=A0A1I4XC87_9GAMM|nr:hypothetical protein SAMN05216516_10451 [Izhakiella capsodis]